MAVYDQNDNLDEYEDDFIDDQDGDVGGIKYKKGVVDEYEDELEEEEEYDEEEEEPVAKEALKVLEYRQKIKEQLRAELRRENGDIVSKLEEQERMPPVKNFGSFFGPSQPVIADRVVQESKALLETQHLVPKASASKNNGQTVNKLPSISVAKNGASRQSLVEQLKPKAQIIKDTRDYSFLFSDDVDIPKQPTMDSVQLKNLAVKTDVTPAQLPAQSNKPSGHSGSKVVNGHKQRKPLGTPRVSSTRIAPVRKLTSDNRSNDSPPDSKRQPDLRKKPPTNNQVSSSTGRGIARSATGKVLPPKKPSSSMDKKLLTEKKAPVAYAGHKVPPVSKHSVSSGKTQPVGTRLHDGSFQHGNRVLKENSGGPKVKIMPPKQGYVRANVYRENPRMQKLPGQLNTCNQSGDVKKGSVNRKRAFEEDDDDVAYQLSMITKRFRRGKYADVDDDDDDDRNMVVDFDTLQREESRSARIARKEDEEELVKIKEEERQEQLRKKAKMRKMCQR